MSSELRRRFFARGDVQPRGRPDGRAQLHAECLIEGADPRIEVTARFSQAICRQIRDADGNPVQSLIAAGRRYDAGEELEEHEVTLADLPNRTARLRTAGDTRAELRDGGAAAGSIVWSWEPLHATLEAWIDEISPGLRRVRVEIANRLEWDNEHSDRAGLRTLRGAHLLLHSPDGAFVSVAQPPARLRAQTIECRNEGLWPVPTGEAGDRRTMLAAPVRLEDYPRLAAVDSQVTAAA
ncbi:MAG TPA: hypothetical protein VFG58_04995 [Solirubrobacterales bacterium]|nr:hypothetical protein [Solirubrobacterales bacterium]